MLGGLAQFNTLSNTDNEDSNKCEKKAKAEMHCHDKENIPTNVRFFNFNFFSMKKVF